MNHKRPPVPVIVILVLALLAAAYFGIRALVTDGNNALAASGTIEAVEVSIAPEIGGRVAQVFVEEGEAVQAGDALFGLDDTLLQAQRSVAAASLETANAAANTAAAAAASASAQYDLALASARGESAAARTSDWRTSGPSGYTLPGWYFGQAEDIAAAQDAVDAARAVRDGAADSLSILLQDPANAAFLTAEERLIAARAAFLTAQDALNRTALAYDNTELHDAAQAAYDAAETELNESQAAYDDLAGGDAGQAVLAVRADLAAAEERYQSAQDRLLALQSGIYSPRVAAAQAAVQQAEAAAAQARLAIAQAEASLALVEVQIAKLTVSAPAGGVILTRTIEPGEVIAAGGVAMILGRLDDLSITVFIPEERYGEISLGQTASLTVDSFPGQTFTATVVYIAGQAEFTPRNVQTAEGRTSTVYAVRLQVEDPDGQLKPGMPADVTFGE